MTYKRLTRHNRYMRWFAWVNTYFYFFSNALEKLLKEPDARVTIWQIVVATHHMHHMRIACVLQAWVARRIAANTAIEV